MGNSNELLYNMQHVQQNTMTITQVRAITTIFIGIGCGIYGFTGLSGFLFFLTFHVLTNVLILLKMGLKPDLYMPKMTSASFLMHGVSSEGLTFILFWTLSNAL